MENSIAYNTFMEIPPNLFPLAIVTTWQVMNITDVDDKIILKARRNHLLKQFFASPPPASDVLDRVRHGILSATTKLQVLAALPLTPHLLTPHASPPHLPRARASWKS